MGQYYSMPSNLQPPPATIMTDEEAKARAQTEAQIVSIEKEVKKQALTSDILPISDLVRQYDDGSNNTTFIRGAKYLAGKYKQVRRIRGDGNCYYRAIMYSVCESMLLGAGSSGEIEAAKKVELERLTTWAKSSMDEVTRHGYDRFAIEMFYEELVELFEYLSTGPPPAEVHAKLNEENGSSEYCTWYLRVVTATYLKSDPDRFLPFIEGGLDVPTFCSQEVEPMGKECSSVQVLALAEAMKVDVVIEYLDGREFDDARGLCRHEFGPSPQSNSADVSSSGTKITLLYRPGHYDILY